MRLLWSVPLGIVISILLIALLGEDNYFYPKPDDIPVSREMAITLPMLLFAGVMWAIQHEVLKASLPWIAGLAAGGSIPPLLAYLAGC